MSKKIIISSLALLAIAGFTFNGVVSADAAPGNKGEQHQQYHNGDGKKMPELTEEQKAEFETLVEKHKAEMAPLQTQLVQKRAEFQAFMKGDNPDPKKAGEMAVEIENLQNKMADSNYAFKETLQEKFDFPEMGSHGRHGGMRGHGGMGGHDGKRGHGNGGHNSMYNCPRF